MALTDRIVGGTMLLASTLIFVYYTTWTLLTPFLDSESPLVRFFPDREWAIRIPALLMLVGLTVVGSFVGLVMIKSARKEREKRRAKGA